MTHVLIACDKFKGSATAAEIAHALATGIAAESADAGTPRVTVSTAPVADGGDGTVDAAVSAGSEPRFCDVAGPYGKTVTGRYALDPSTRTAIIEVAAACGLVLVDEDELSTGRITAVDADSSGVGHLILHALDAGATSIVITLGGSATTDAGSGMMQVLGARITDSSGAPVRPGARGLADAHSVDLTHLDPRLRETSVVIASDVTNPLCGANGAAEVFGPQKGLRAEGIPVVDRSLDHFSDLVEDALGMRRGSCRDSPGAGAAGGLGFAALSMLGGELRPGIDVVLEMVGFDDALATADLVITGEGKLDSQTLAGKAPAGVSTRAQAHDIPVVAVCGVSELEEEQLRAFGFKEVFQLIDIEPDLSRCISDPLPLLSEVGRRIRRSRLT
ncbi:glycerate kinase [Corynebacterium glyciniphilum]|uniref:glycerate kinase n=1 Tax=Corynebacterium glyciniphilum TaxID=1404244 RepID=UPI002354E08A